MSKHHSRPVALTADLWRADRPVVAGRGWPGGWTEAAAFYHFYWRFYSSLASRNSGTKNQLQLFLSSFKQQEIYFHLEFPDVVLTIYSLHLHELLLMLRTKNNMEIYAENNFTGMFRASLADFS